MVPQTKRIQNNWFQIFRFRLGLRAEMLEILWKTLWEKERNLFVKIWKCPETQKFLLIKGLWVEARFLTRARRIDLLLPHLKTFSLKEIPL
jgi:hypothetical protein